MAVRQESLGEATWGERLMLARRRAGINLDEAARRVSLITPVSYGSLIRLEKLAGAPSDPRRRMVGFLVVWIYGYNPREFDLSHGDLPRWITDEVLDDLRDPATIRDEGRYLSSAA